MSGLKLSILVPVYNVEKYIRPFFESIFRQGLPEEDYEIIVVNDGTPDRSMEVVADLLEQHDNITVIKQENQGLSVARNVALDRASGEYVLMLDSDDLLVDGSLPVLIEKAIETKVDMVIADYLIMNNLEISNLTRHPNQSPIKYVIRTGKQLFLEELSPYKCHVWHRLFKRSFLQENHIRFISDIYFQDVPFTHECYLKVRNGIKTNCLLNIYRKWDGSVQSLFTLRHAKDFSKAIGKTWELKKSACMIGLNADKKLTSNVFTSFSLMIRETMNKIDGLPNKLRAMDFLQEYAPDLRFTDGAAQKVITLLYHISPRLLLIVWLLKKKFT